MVEKTKWKPSEFPLPGKYKIKTALHLWRDDVQISVTIKDLKDARVVFPTTSTFNSTI